MISRWAPSSSSCASTIAVLAGAPLCRGGVGVLALACDCSNGAEHLRCHVAWKGVDGSGQVWDGNNALGNSKRWLPECRKEQDSPAMLMLAGVAFREAGVRVRLLLLGVMPLKGQKSLDHNHNILTNVTLKCIVLQYLVQALGNGP